MPPISLHLDDPIKPQNDQTDQTIDASTGPTKTVVTTVNQQSASSGHAYPPARPGAAAVPAPTGYVVPPQPAPSRTIPENQPQRQQYAPPPPQPGAAPVPPGQFQAPVTSAHPQITPAPPQPGAVPISPAQYQGVPATNPSTAGQAPGAVQSTSFTSSLNQMYAPPSFVSPREVGGPVTARPGAPAGGYQQNVYAQDLTSAQRMSLQEQERRENPHAVSLGGGPAGESITASVGEAAGNAWNVVKGWTSGAGEKLAEVEKEVWKRINPE